jgi:hypothetical protein
MFKNKNHKSGKSMTLGRPACSAIQMIQGLPIRAKCLAYCNLLCLSHTALNKVCELRSFSCNGNPFLFSPILLC